MEVPQAKGKLSTVMGYEFLGTAMLVYAVNVSCGFPLAVVGITGTLWICIMIMGPITGGHCNPAVSIGVLFASKKPMEEIEYFIKIVISQLLGGFFGLILAFFSLRNAYS